MIPPFIVRSSSRTQGFLRSRFVGSVSALAILAVVSCGASPGLSHEAPSAGAGKEARSEIASPPAAASSKGGESDEGKTGKTGKAGARLLTIPEARRYMVELINRDRATEGLSPVVLDEGPATRAGQAHAEDMARLGYLGHWGSDGSVPEQRYTEAGGADMVLENALCFTDEKVRELDPDPRIDAAAIERAEDMFFHEVPPNDGHRRNILGRAHTKVGVGIAQPKSTPTEIAVPCMTHEFVDTYGTYAPLPKAAKVGATVRVEGTLGSRALPVGIGIARVALPRPLSPKELNKRRSYPVPKPYQMYWKAGFVTPKPVQVDGRRFAIELPLSQGGQPGLYEISVWANLDGSKEHSLVGLRTIRVE